MRGKFVIYGPQGCIVYKTLGFLGFCPALQCLGHLMPQNFGIFQALQCLGHLMPQNFGIFTALQCLVYLRATKHRNARKFQKFSGKRCSKHFNARNIQKNTIFPIYGPQAYIVYKILGFLGFSKHYSVWAPHAPKLWDFSHYSAWCTSELRNTAMLENSKSSQARGAANTLMREISKKTQFSRSMALKPT